MTVCVTTIPQALAQPSKFQLVFDRAANTVIYCTAVTIPGIRLGETPIPTPFIDLYVPGDKISYDTLDISFLLDARYTSWLDIQNWMTGLGFPENFEQYKNLTKNAARPGQSGSNIGIRPPYSDASLILFTNKNNPQLQLDFKDCFPISLSSINLNYQESADVTLTAVASFRFSYFTIKRF